MRIGKVGHHHLMSHLHGEADEQRELEAYADNGRIGARKQRRDEQDVNVGKEEREQRDEDQRLGLAPDLGWSRRRVRCRRSGLGNVLAQQEILREREPCEDGGQ
ncbi:MAG: hypothetical protein R3D30_03305 [Hyphomicrobiales bacterium]